MLGLGNSLITTVAPSAGFELTDISGLEIWYIYSYRGRYCWPNDYDWF